MTAPRQVGQKWTLGGIATQRHAPSQSPAAGLAALAAVAAAPTPKGASLLGFVRAS